MLSIGVQETEHIAGNLQETFVSISVPRHPLAQQMLKCWHKRPADGFRIDRDIPATGTDNPLHHVMAWQPTPDMSDFIVCHVGRGLHGQFPDSSEAYINRRMSQLMTDELFAYQRHICPHILKEDRIEALDVSQSHNGFDYLHYEMLMFTARDRDNAHWLITAFFSF